MKKKKILCPNCDGTKVDPETGEKCKECNGTGYVEAIDDNYQQVKNE